MPKVSEVYVPGNFRDKVEGSSAAIRKSYRVSLANEWIGRAEPIHYLEAWAGLGIAMKPGRLVLTEEHDRPHPGPNTGFCFQHFVKAGALNVIDDKYSQSKTVRQGSTRTYEIK